MQLPVSRLVSSAALSGLLFCATGAFAQAPQPKPPQPKTPPSPQSPPPSQKPGDGKPAAPATPPVKPGQPKPYKDVVTAEAKSDKGIFTVHRIDERILFEIPANQFGKDMLWQTELAQTGSGAGYGGESVGSKVIRWERRNNTVYIRGVSYELRGDNKGAIQLAVDAANVSPILASFQVEAEGENKSAVVDVTRFYVNDAGPVPAGPAVGGGADPSRSYLDRIKAFPTNIEARVVVTFNRAGGPSRFGSQGGPVTTTVHHSMTLLPDKPMIGRYFDPRVGFFTEGFSDYASSEHQVKEREYAARYRLEKKDPTAKVSDPVKPIVYYVSREVPERWREYVRQGIEDWQPAFEQAGFSHAIIGKLAPTEKDDPNWDPEDARYSVIRWAAQPVENAMGPHVHDPRSGEIISAHVIIWHDVMKLAEQWYFVQCADLDPKAARLPLPDPLMGELLRYIVAHEVGHTLGLRHNHKASSSYTIAQLRSKEFTEMYGDEASIMDYGRFNYVAQPGDNARLIPLLGPYDKFAIEWGYKPIDGVRTSEDEKPALDMIAARQVNNPMLRFGGEDMVASVDPTVQTEDLGNDPVEATRMGLKNLDRIMPMLIPATTHLGEPYDQLRDLYMQVFNQRLTELLHVSKLVGGVVETRYMAGRGGESFQPVSRAKQKEAVQFLLENGFTIPKSLLNPTILNRIDYGGFADRMTTIQLYLLINLLSEARIHRLAERDALTGGSSYTVSELVNDLQKGIWSELDSPKPVVDIYRRNLQRYYLKVLQPRLVGDSSSVSELRPVGISALRQLLVKVNKAQIKSTDNLTRMHLADCKTQIEDILYPKVSIVSGPGGTSGPVSRALSVFEENRPESQNPDFRCDLMSNQNWLRSLLEPTKTAPNK